MGTIVIPFTRSMSFWLARNIDRGSFAHLNLLNVLSSKNMGPGDERNLPCALAGDLLL